MFGLGIGVPLQERGSVTQQGVPPSDEMAAALGRLGPLARELGHDEIDIGHFLLALLRHDPFICVRREALEATVRQLPDPAVEALRDALFDRSYSMRELPDST